MSRIASLITRLFAKRKAVEEDRLNCPPHPGTAELRIYLWNIFYPVGTPVQVIFGGRHVHRTRTTSRAWIDRGKPVVKLEGLALSHFLANVSPVFDEEEGP